MNSYDCSSLWNCLGCQCTMPDHGLFNAVFPYKWNYVSNFASSTFKCCITGPLRRFWSQMSFFNLSRDFSYIKNSGLIATETKTKPPFVFVYCPLTCKFERLNDICWPLLDCFHNNLAWLTLRKMRKIFTFSYQFKRENYCLTNKKTNNVWIVATAVM